MDKGNTNYKGMNWRPGFHEGLVESSAEGLRPSALESSKLPTKDFWLQISVEVKDKAAREKNSNFSTFNSHEFAISLQRQTRLGEAQVHPSHFTKVQLKIKEQTSCESVKLQKQLWNEPEEFN